MSAAQHDPQNPPRRNFFKEALCAVIGGAITLVPVAAGIRVFLDPLRKRKDASAGAAIRVTSLSALPDDGLPRKFPVIADKADAWNKYPQVPIGAVYLLRKGDKITALNVICPHAGCFVDFNTDCTCYLCPCHNSKFNLDGTRTPASPSPRDMDSLKVELRGNDIFVVFQNYRAGEAERIPVS